MSKLVLARNIGERIDIGADVQVQVVSVHIGQMRVAKATVRLLIDAPPQVAIDRTEVPSAKKRVRVVPA